MQEEEKEDLTLWAIEYVMKLPPPEGESSGLLCVPLPWEEGDQVQAAVMLYESEVLARAGLEHYLARIGAEEENNAPSPYRLVALERRELVSILKTRPKGGFERVVINPILSRYFPEAESYAASLPIDEFVKSLDEFVKSLKSC